VHGGALAATLRVRLAAGKYRATVAVSGAGGTAQRVAALTLRSRASPPRRVASMA
jgi:hypothetical protein